MRGRTVVIIGATGGVGEGLVEEFLEAGANVIATSRSPEKLEELRSRLGSPAALKGVTGGAGSEEEAARLARDVSGVSATIDGAIASIGSWWQGPPLLQTALHDFDAVIAQRLTSHFLAAKAIVPLILKKPAGFYFLIGGASAEIPIPNSGPVSIAGAGQAMLTRVLRAEAKGQPIRIQELMVWTTIATRAHGGSVDPAWITPREVARHLIALAADPASDREAVVHLRKRADVGKVS
ncbi:MAG TPA: SDR family oxidoreductase [Burkholderiales bacterium]|jgi:NAD(P)-dependent dehydrogenase (short-subunit alcohol dehydrogenase family)|nr:SDR family oxidoreductase [Burkholderiales bacterium]